MVGHLGFISEVEAELCETLKTAKKGEKRFIERREAYPESFLGEKNRVRREGCGNPVRCPFGGAHEVCGADNKNSCRKKNG